MSAAIVKTKAKVIVVTVLFLVFFMFFTSNEVYICGEVLVAFSKITHRTSDLVEKLDDSVKHRILIASETANVYVTVFSVPPDPPCR